MKAADGPLGILCREIGGSLQGYDIADTNFLQSIVP